MSPNHAPDSVHACDYVETDWDRFSSLQRLGNHWDRPGWESGRRSYFWMLTFNAAELRTLASQCQASFRRTRTLNLVPLDGLHLTLQRVGFADELDRDVINAIAKAAHTECADLTAFTLTVGPLAGSSGAVRFSAGPHQPVHQIRNAVRRADATVRGSDSVPARTKPFVPHISIAYNNADIAAQPVIDQIKTLRELPPVCVTVDTVDLVEMRRRDRAYIWEPVASVRLALARTGDAATHTEPRRP